MLADEYSQQAAKSSISGISFGASAFCLLHVGFLLGLLFGLEDGGDVPPKRRLTFTRLYGVISQKTEFYSPRCENFNIYNSRLYDWVISAISLYVTVCEKNSIRNTKNEIGN
jgi:hypothetical protein